MSAKVVLRNKPYPDGSCPLIIRIIKDRKASIISLGYGVHPKDWDSKAQRVKKSHRNSTRLNNFILTKLAEVSDTSLELDSTKKQVTAKAIRQKVKPKAGNSVFEVADAYVSSLKEAGKFRRWTNEGTNVRHLKKFLQNDIPFSELTISVLERFKASLIVKRKVSERTAVNNWVTVRSVFSYAIKEGACDTKYYPFGKGKLKIKFPDTKKVGLTVEDVARIENAELEGAAHHARNLWLISFYFAGIRVSDVLKLKWSDFHGGRLYYAMGKNHKGDSLLVSNKVEEILSQYETMREDGCDLIFPELRGVDLTDKFEAERKCASKIGIIDKWLRTEVKKVAKIEQPLTMHISRHTFGNISGDSIPVQMLQKLYRHTDIKTTIGYQSNFIHSDVDDALSAVMSRI